MSQKRLGTPEDTLQEYCEQDIKFSEDLRKVLKDLVEDDNALFETWFANEPEITGREGFSEWDMVIMRGAFLAGLRAGRLNDY